VHGSQSGNDLQETTNWFTLVWIKAHPEKKTADATYGQNDIY